MNLEEYQPPKKKPNVLVVANSQNRDFGTPDPVALEIVRKNKERKAASAAKQWAEVMRERSD
jgi:hypothetical protein